MFNITVRYAVILTIVGIVLVKFHWESVVSGWDVPPFLSLMGRGAGGHQAPGHQRGWKMLPGFYLAPQRTSLWVSRHP